MEISIKKTFFIFYFISQLTFILNSSMIPGWPDAIDCGGAGNPGQIFFIHGGGHYHQIYTPEVRNVIFNSSKQFLSRSGYNDASQGCDGKSIEELYLSGRAIDLVHSKNSGVTDTMVLSWPDALKCGAGSTPDQIFFLHWGLEHGIAQYNQVYSAEDRNVIFGSSKEFISRVGHSDASLGCEGQTIQQLYVSGRAFNLKLSQISNI